MKAFKECKSLEESGHLTNSFSRVGREWRKYTTRPKKFIDRF